MEMGKYKIIDKNNKIIYYCDEYRELVSKLTNVVNSYREPYASENDTTKILESIEIQGLSSASLLSAISNVYSNIHNNQIARTTNDNTVREIF